MWPHAKLPDPDLLALEDWLTRWRIGGPHGELHEGSYNTRVAGSHRGYEAISCVTCARPFIRGRGNTVTDCGSWACRVGKVL